MKRYTVFSMLSRPIMAVAMLMTYACTTSGGATQQQAATTNNTTGEKAAEAKAETRNGKAAVAKVNETKPHNTATTKATDIKQNATTTKATIKAPQASVAKAKAKTNTPVTPATMQAKKEPSPATAEPTTSNKTATKEERRLSKYVTAQTLNVRERPSTDAAVVAKLARGSLVPVVIEGDWAKLGDNQYVLSKYLSNNRPSPSKNMAMSH